MTISWELRLFLFEVALFCIALGTAWLNGYPKYNSIYGLRLRKALESEANWKRLHALCGWLWIVIGIWIAAPWSDLGLILVAQVPIAFLISVVGLFFVYRRI